MGIITFFKDFWRLNKTGLIISFIIYNFFLFIYFLKENFFMNFNSESFFSSLLIAYTIFFVVLLFFYKLMGWFEND